MISTLLAAGIDTTLDNARSIAENIDLEAFGGCLLNTGCRDAIVDLLHRGYSNVKEFLAKTIQALHSSEVKTTGSTGAAPTSGQQNSSNTTEIMGADGTTS